MTLNGPSGEILGENEICVRWQLFTPWGKMKYDAIEISVKWR